MRGQPMKPRRSPLVITLLCLALLVPCATPPRAARAADRHPVPPVEEEVPGVKISRDLLPAREVEGAQSSPRLVEEQVRAIVQTKGESAAWLDEFLTTHGGRLLRRFSRFKASAVELPADALLVLAEMPDVRYVSKDRQTRRLGHVSLTTGAD